MFVEAESEKRKILECVWRELPSEQLFTGGAGYQSPPSPQMITPRKMCIKF